MSDTMILVAVFVSVLILAFTVISIINSRRQIDRNLQAVQEQGRANFARNNQQLDTILGSENEYIRHYFDVLKRDAPDSLRRRLISAGHFSPTAVRTFTTIRIIVALAVFLLAWFALRTLRPDTTSTQAIVTAMLASAFSFIGVMMLLERRAKKRRIEYRKLFPDFMDLLIVCIDAGLSIEASLDRVTREFLLTNHDFGMHLSIIGLEVRAGRPMHEALTHFAERIKVEEARSLATLFKQSEELGSSVSKTLRVFAKEMRQKRIIRAEEKANALPVKMLFPMALCMFPVNLIIVLVPILMTIFKLFMGLGPEG